MGKNKYITFFLNTVYSQDVHLAVCLTPVMIGSTDLRTTYGSTANCM